tara:strand:+ start:364 stop:786 length:423 start_codon:yes stop_codon:yes gene_type:complete
MKPTLIVLIVGILAVGCLTSEQKQKALRDSVVGEYENKGEDGTTEKYIFLVNGAFEKHANGKKIAERKWSIVNKGNPLIINGITMERKLASHLIHIHHSGRLFHIFRINSDKSISQIGHINNEIWSRYTKNPPPSLKKIK